MCGKMVSCADPTANGKCENGSLKRVALHFEIPGSQGMNQQQLSTIKICFELSCEGIT